MPADKAWGRERIVDWLVGDAGLVRVAEEACRTTGANGWEEQVAYCLVTLVRKDDPPRTREDGVKRCTYCLDPGASEFAENLARWATEIARNLKRWGRVYAAIQAEAERHEVSTLRGMIGSHHADDVVDAVADHLTETLASSPPLEEMTLGYARRFDPGPRDYAFQRPLSRWVRTAWRRAKPPDSAELEDEAEVVARGGVREEARQRDAWDEVRRAAALRDEAARALIVQVAALARTRGLLSAAIEHAEDLERGLAGRRATSIEADGTLARLRATILDVTDALSRERRALKPMLAYGALAMRKAPQLQRVTALSLRDEAIERAAVDSMAAQMRAIVADRHQPTPALLSKVRDATRRGLVASRAAALDELREGRDRATQLAPVRQMLDELPPVVAGVPAIAEAIGRDAGIVATNRHQAVTELRKVDAVYARVFRRYAMGFR